VGQTGVALIGPHVPSMYIWI